MNVLLIKANPKHDKNNKTAHFNYPLTKYLNTKINLQIFKIKVNQIHSKNKTNSVFDNTA